MRGGDKVPLDPTTPHADVSDNNTDTSAHNAEDAKLMVSELLARLTARSDQLVSVQSRLDKLNSTLKYVNILRSVHFDTCEPKNAFQVSRKLTPDSQLTACVTNKSVTLEDPFFRFYQLNASVRLETISDREPDTYIMNKQSNFKALRPNESQTVVFDLRESIAENFYPVGLNLSLSFNVQSFLRTRIDGQSADKAESEYDADLEELFEDENEEHIADVTVCLFEYDFELGDFLIAMKVERDPAAVLAQTNDFNPFFRQFLSDYESLKRAESCKFDRNELESSWNSVSIDGVSIDKNPMLKKLSGKP